MATVSDINNAIIKSYAYALELGNELYSEQIKGCIDCYDTSKIECILMMSETLQHWVDIDELGKHTDELYANLLEVISDYYGDVPDLDENAYIPQTTLVNGSSRWGYIYGNIEEQADLMALLATKADLGDGLLTPVDVNIVGNNAVVSAKTGSEITWKDGMTTVTVSSPQTFPVSDATDNYFRKDRIVLTLTGMELIEGVETQSVAIPPNIPVGAINLVIIDVYGDQINSGTPNPPIDLTVPSWTVYGSQPFGKYTNLQTVPAANSAFEQYREAWTNIAPPTYLAPLSTLTSTPATTGLEIGQSVNVNLTLAFNQRDGGTETSRVINKNGSPLGGTTDTIVISDTPVNYQGNISYGQGDVKNNAAGIPDPTGRIEAGSISSGVISYRGDYPLFATTSSITVATKQPIVNMNTANNVQINLVAESGGNKQFFEIPDAWLALRPLTYIQYFNTVSNQFDTSNKMGDFAITSVNETIQGNVVGYKRYTYIGSDRANILIRLGF